MTSGTILLVGGPADGTVLDAAYRDEPMRVPVAPKMTARWWEGRPEQIEVKTVYYVPQRIAFLGLIMVVHVADGTPMERVEATLARVLLSDLAHALVRGG